jgi:aminodeoxyfutalosine deaminase
VLFYELIRFNAPDPAGLVERAVHDLEALTPTDKLRTSLAAHAPYSVAPLVFREIRRAIDRHPFTPVSVHLSESAEEIEFIRTGGGPWRALLEEIGSWDPAWVAPGGSPVQFLDESGFLDRRVLAVHGVQMSTSDLDRLVAHGATLVTCPRSNGHTGAGAPPIEDFYNYGVNVAVGTDSLASAPDLNVFAELATLRALAPSVSAGALLDSATRQGARALGFDADYGTIEPGKVARLLAVAIPPDTADVEEYLVSGIEPSQIRWIEA